MMRTRLFSLVLGLFVIFASSAFSLEIYQKKITEGRNCLQGAIDDGLREKLTTELLESQRLLERDFQNQQGESNELQLAFGKLDALLVQCVSRQDMEIDREKRPRDDAEREAFKNALKNNETNSKGAHFIFIPYKKGKGAKISYNARLKERITVSGKLLPLAYVIKEDQSCVIQLLAEKDIAKARSSKKALEYFSREDVRMLVDQAQPDLAQIVGTLFPRGRDQSITQEFEGLLSVAFSEKKMQRSMDEINYAKNYRRVFDGVFPNKLPGNSFYTFVVTLAGQLSFGQVHDAWEYGVKHMHIAQNRPVVAAGEMWVGNNEVQFNLQSGSFTKYLINLKKVSQQELSEAVLTLFKILMPETEVIYRDLDIFKEDQRVHRSPTNEEWERLCTWPNFSVRNPSFCPPPAPPQ